MSKLRFCEVVASAPKPGREADYNEWYDNHIKEMFRFNGLKKVSRKRCYKPLPPMGSYKNESDCPQYLTTYEFESKEDLDAFWATVVAPVNPEKIKKEKGVDSYDLLWAAYYETVIELER